MSDIVVKDIKWRVNTKLVYSFDSLPAVPVPQVPIDTTTLSFREFIHHPEAQPVIANTGLLVVLFCIVLFRSR